MEKLKYDICGSSIMVQPRGQVAVCESCGVRYSIGRMREKIQEIKGVVSVEGTVQTQDADFIIRGGVLTRYNGNDVHITIPDTVVEIGSKAFEKCAGIQSIKMSKSVTCIGDFAFYGCRSLIDVELSKNLIEIKMGAFFECTALKRILLPDTLVTINRSAFEGCISLESINIPDSVQRGFLTLDQAVVNCPALKEVHISEQHLKSLGFLSPIIFEKEETNGDFSTYYIRPVRKPC